jgi:indole-3-glycerol phosphate synthase
MEETNLAALTENFLDKVVEMKQQELSRLREMGMTRLETLAYAARKPRDFLSNFHESRTVPIIAEIKKAAPSWKGFRKNVDVKNVAGIYESYGAAAISVLTDSLFFGGSIDDLSSAAEKVAIPILRKDFMIGVEQVFEARAAGADAVLLIVAILDDDTLKELFETTTRLGMIPLLEIHNENEVSRAVRLNPQLIGINNRNLKTLEVNLEVSERLRKMIPHDVTVVAESGIADEADIKRLLEAGIDGFLIGTTLMKSPDPGKTLHSLVNLGRM